jgi:hypothetical protein
MRAIAMGTLVASAVAVASGCVRVNYRGDGVLTRQEAPAWFRQDRFSIDPGPVDFTRKVHVTRWLAGLPIEEYAAGFVIHSREARSGLRDSARAERKPRPSVVLVVLDEHGRSVLDRRGNLSDWIWSGAPSRPDDAFVYARGAHVEVSDGRGTVRVERQVTGAHSGWGTYFTPRRGAHYLLKLDIEDPDPDAGAYDVALRWMVSLAVSENRTNPCRT